MYYIIWNEIFSFFPVRFEMYISVAWFWNLFIIMWTCVWCGLLCFWGHLCSFYQFLDKFLFHHDNYKYQVYGYDRTLFIGQQHPITVYRTGFWVCVVLVFSVICVPFVDTRGEVIGRFTNKHNLCILNDGTTHTYLKPQAQHANKPTSAIDLIISTPGLALRSVREVLPDTHGSDNYPILTSILPSVAEIQPSCDPSQWFFCKAKYGPVSWCVYGKYLWGYTRRGRNTTSLKE